jgi:ligand-binding sensor domain-containing protein
MVLAQSTTSGLSQYKITSWTTDDGLPGNACIKIFQDSEGYLWIGSFDGLVRFDGTRFTTYNKRNLLISNYALAITGDDTNNLWVGTDHGIIHFMKDVVTDLSDDSIHNFHVESLFLDKQNNKLWIGARNAGLFTLDLITHQYSLMDGPGTDDIVNDIYKDQKGNLWVATEKNGLMQYTESKKWIRYGVPDGLLSTEIKSLHEDRDHVFYVGTTSGLFIQRPGEKFAEQPNFKSTRINKVISDSLGNVWVGTVNGLYLQSKTDKKWHTLTRDDGLSNNDIRDIYFDREGSIWLGTYRGGLNQLRETKFTTYFSKGGPVIEAVGALCGLDDGALLIGTTEGKLFTLKDDQIKPYPVKHPIHQRIYAILYDNKKNIWIVSYDGLLLITRNGKEKLITEKDGLLTKQLRTIIQDSNNTYWIGTRNAGLIKMKYNSESGDLQFEQYMHEALSNVNSTFIMHLSGGLNGDLLISTNNGGLTILSQDSHVTNFNKNNGLESNTCFVAKQDSAGTIWIGTSEGLTRLKNGKAFTFTRKDGMPHENPMDVIEDDLGFFWLPTQKGTIRVNKQQLNDYADAKLKSIDWKLFDRNNDLEKSECTGTARALVTADKRIWFPMISGLMSVDPATIQLNKKSPTVYIEKISIGDNTVDPSAPVSIRAGSPRIAFDYIALTLLYPNSARYKYKLENFDADWIDAGTTRQAVYTSLPSGNYTFQVMAGNMDGVWGDVPMASASIMVMPRIYQTWWFITLSILGVLGAVYAYISIRTKAIKARSTYLEHLVNERTRLIAQQRDELVALNEDLRSSREEVLAQRDSLAEKIKELAEKNEEIAQINANLEQIVEQRTNVLEEQNKRISEYAFINAHKLRAPLASILGIINLMNHEATTEAQLTLNNHLLKSADALDEIVRSINQMLEEEVKNEPEADEESSPEKK